jgi:predicted unusual protein kinase regulating ubiquinone biosynthesis (AarF/ABC1/UbiB family)
MNTALQLLTDYISTGNVNDTLLRGGGLLTKVTQLRQAKNANAECFSDAYPLNVQATNATFATFCQQPMVRARVSKVDPDAFQRGSIGQVYKGVLLSGEEVCFKVQYNGLPLRVREQLALFTKVTWVARLMGHRTIGSIDTELKSMIAHECDTAHEIANQQRMLQLFADMPDYHIPKIHTVLSTTPGIICMEFMHGTPLGKYISSQQTELALGGVAQKIASFLMVGLIRGGMVYTDVHFGNFFVDAPSGQLGVIDFGSVKTFSAARKEAVVEFLHYCVYWETSDILMQLKKLGVEVPTHKTERDHFLQLIKEAYRPFTCNGPFLFTQEWVDNLNTFMYSPECAKTFTPPDLMWFFRLVYGLGNIMINVGFPLDLRTVVIGILDTVYVPTIVAESESCTG